MDDIEKLIDDLELCHHKAERHVELIIAAIGSGSTDKGSGTRQAGSRHPAEDTWQKAIDFLCAWLDGDMSRVADCNVGDHPPEYLAGLLGEHTPLKDWQVSQIVRKLKAASRMYPDVEYREMVEYPEAYADAKEFRDITVATIINDTKNGEPAEISLGAMIDHLQPCNWGFLDNFQSVLHAINGHLELIRPFAAHARNLCWSPIANKMRSIASTLREFCGDGSGEPVDSAVLERLGEKTETKVDLARRLERKLSDAFAHSGLPPELETLRHRLEALEAVRAPNVELKAFFFPWCDFFYGSIEHWVRGGIEIDCNKGRRRAGIGILNSELRVCGVDYDLDGPSLFGVLPNEDAVVAVMEAFAAKGLGAAVEAFENLGGKRPGGVSDSV